MRPTRSSLRGRSRAIVLAALCCLAVASLTACGGAAAAPTPTALATVGVAASPAPSPARPALASPAASPSAAVAAVVTPTTASTDVAATTGGDTYEVQSGDTLLTIAQQYYDDVTQWRRIYDANKDAIGADPDKLKLGTKLTIPPKKS